jgi:hypothetical protein
MGLIPSGPKCIRFFWPIVEALCEFGGSAQPRESPIESSRCAPSATMNGPRLDTRETVDASPDSTASSGRPQAYGTR